MVVAEPRTGRRNRPMTEIEMIRMALLLLSFVCAAAHAQAQTRWTMATEYPATAIAGEGMSTFARLVEEKSHGQLTVQTSFNAELKIKSAAMLAAVQKGTVAAGDAFSGQLGSIEPIFGLSSLPFVATSFDDAHKLATLARSAYVSAFARHGQKLLYTVPWPPSGIWSKEPVQTVDQIRALVIRTYDPTSTKVMAGAGAKTLQLSFVDATPKLKDGTLNAVLSSGDGGAGRKLWQYLPRFTEINYAIPLSFATVNDAAYAALSDDARRAVDAAAAETEAHVWSIIGSRLQKNYQRMAENGVTIEKGVTPELKAVLQRAATDSIEKWTATAAPDGGEILGKFHSK
jgi:TRAP-type C4-dicarboxylate transport system substrate-binding protein